MFGTLSANLKNKSTYSTSPTTASEPLSFGNGSSQQRYANGNSSTTTSSLSSSENKSAQGSQTPNRRNRSPQDPEMELRRALSSLNADEIKESGNSFYRRGKFEDALKLYDRAVMLEPRLPQYRTNRAAALAGLGLINEAIKDCKDAISLDLNYARAHQRLASCLIRAGKLDEARTALRVAPSSDAMNGEIMKLSKIESHVRRADDFVSSGEWNLALKEVIAAIDSGADLDLKLLKWKAEALFHLRFLDDSDEVIQRILKLEASSAFNLQQNLKHKIFLLKARVELATGGFDRAISSLEAAMAIGIESEVARELLTTAQALNAVRSQGNQFFKSGNFVAALESYSRGLESLDPTNALLLCNRSACYSKLNDWNSALQDAESALTSYPKYVKAMLRRAACQMKLAMWSEAAQSYKGLLEFLPEDPEMLKLLAEAKVNLAQKNGAPVLPKPVMDGGRVVEISNEDQFRTIIENFNLVVIDFFATWCGPCKQIAPLVARLAGQYRNARFIKIDIDKNRELAMAENISSVPTFKIFRNGIQIHEILGANGAELERYLSHCSGN